MSLIKEGLRIFLRSGKISFSGFKKYSGTDEEICKNIIDRCYDKEKKFFRTSLGNYPEFYSRDFGMCCELLSKSGYEDKVIKTLEYAMKNFDKSNKITVLITPDDKPINFPDIYSPDSVAYLFRSLRISDAEKLVIKHKEFLNKEIKKFEQTVIDGGIVKKEHFSGMRDHAIVKSSTYDMIMACMLCDEIDKINKIMNKKILYNRLKKYDLKKNLIKHYWNGIYFKNSIDDDSFVSHNNVFPYWLDVIKDKKSLASSINEIQKRDLDKPFPLKYIAEKSDKGFVWQNIFVKNWETDKIWGFLGMPYIKILSSINKNKAKQHLKQYEGLIEKNGFVEVYDNYEPFKTFFFASDTDMIWACMYLELKNKIKKK